jgi:hypothetical protein
MSKGQQKKEEDKEEPSSAMIPLSAIMAERTVSELFETSQFLLECDTDLLLLNESLSEEDGQAPPPDDSFLFQLDSHDRMRDQELLLEQPIDDVAGLPSFPPPLPPPPPRRQPSGPARRTRSQTSASFYSPSPFLPVLQGTVTPHDSMASSRASTTTASPPPVTSSGNTTDTTYNNNNNNYTSDDVILGRGGKSNNHPGNQLYLRDKDLLQARYFSVSKREKTAIAQELVDRVHARGGRFMKEIATTTTTTANDDRDERPMTTTIAWIEVSNDHARRKASQSLREVSSKESRANKREKYRKHNSSSSSSSSHKKKQPPGQPK